MTGRGFLTGEMDVDARTWSTPVTGPKLQHGNARLKPTTYPRGYFRMEGIAGYTLYHVKGGRLPVQQLQRREVAFATGQMRPRWKTWMVDDPLHWYGMKERVMALPPGEILVAGLGLGLFAHLIAELRPDITRVTVVEIDPDVIALVRQTMPDDWVCDGWLQLVEADYYEYIARPDIERPAAILWDLAVGGADETAPDYRRAAIMTARALPGVPLSCFGLVNGANTIFGDLW